MYQVVLDIHSIVRWLVLLAALYALVTAYWGWASGRWSRPAGLAFTFVLDLQLLVGILLYIVSPLTRGAMQNFSAAMKNSNLRFFAVEHEVLMLIAIIIAHIAAALGRGAASPRGKSAREAVGFSVAVIIILLAIPWGRPLFP